MSRLDYDALEAAGHRVVLVTPIHAGTSTYVCPRCGCLFQSFQGELVLFHVPEVYPIASPGGLLVPSETQCIPAGMQSLKPTLEVKLATLERASWERLRKAAADD